MLLQRVRPCCSSWVRNSSSAGTFRAADLTITRTTSPAEKPDPDKLVFGHHFSDHIMTCRWAAGTGWEKPEIRPLEPLVLHPAAKVFHYAQEIFEGMKAYRGEDDRIRLFRPDLNMARFQRSAKRSCLPAFDEEELGECIKQLVRLEDDWVPHSRTSTLYIRPSLIGCEPTLGIAPSKEALLFVLTGPVGPYFPTGFKPVTLMADPDFVRSWPGGTGASKMGCNYSPTMHVQKVASDQNCQQVLWLFDKDEKLTEVGTMNVFLVLKKGAGVELVTPGLESGLILPGVTRQSILELASGWENTTITQRDVTMKEVLSYIEDGSLLEMFGAGTACVVCPVSGILYRGRHFIIPTMEHGAPVCTRALKELTDIQYGKTPHPWSVLIDP